MALEEFPAFNTEPDPVVPLLQKLLEGEPLSGEETQLLEEWKSRSEANQALIARLGEPEAVKEMLRKWHGVEKSREQNKLRGMNRVSELAAAAGPVPRVHFLRNKFFRYAAAVLILLGSGVYFVTLKTR